VEENKQMNRKNFHNQIDQINSTYEGKRFKNEFSSINAKSTNFTIVRKDQNSNVTESNNLIYTNCSQPNDLNNFSNSNNNHFPHQTLKKASKDNKNNFFRRNDNLNKNECLNVLKINSKTKKDSSSPFKRKLDFRLKPKPELPEKKKRKLVLNSYKNINRIMKIIKESDNLKSNENLCKHFRNIRYNKKVDEITNKLLNVNKLSIQDYEEVDLGN
jgi:hypothetical protein